MSYITCLFNIFSRSADQLENKLTLVITTQDRRDILLILVVVKNFHLQICSCQLNSIFSACLAANGMIQGMLVVLLIYTIHVRCRPIAFDEMLPFD